MSRLICTYVRTHVRHVGTFRTHGVLEKYFGRTYIKNPKKRSASQTNFEVNAIIFLAELLKSELFSSTFDYVKVGMFLLNART